MPAAMGKKLSMCQMLQFREKEAPAKVTRTVCRPGGSGGTMGREFGDPITTEFDCLSAYEQCCIGVNIVFHRD